MSGEARSLCSLSRAHRCASGFPIVPDILVRKTGLSVHEAATVACGHSTSGHGEFAHSHCFHLPEEKAQLVKEQRGQRSPGRVSGPPGPNCSVPSAPL